MVWPKAAAGRLTRVVINPPEVSVQADRPAKGFPDRVLMGQT